MPIGSNLKSSIVGSCQLCNRTGFACGKPCSCLIKFRAFNRLTSGGFSLKTLDLVTQSGYEIPQIASGESFVSYFADNPEKVEEQGLSLYIHSKGKGRGKTTLAQYLVYKAATLFSHTENYSTKRDYAFINIEDLIKQERKNDNSMWTRTWLVIDDIGNEDRSAPWKHAAVISIMQQVMHYRRDRNLPTIITSNYEPVNLSTLYSGEIDSLLEIGSDGKIGGLVFREVEVGGGEDFRQIEEFSAWPI